MSDVKETTGSAMDRRALLAQAGLLGLGAAALALPSPAWASGRPLLDIVNVPDDGNFAGIPGRNRDEVVLNYALTLETLEADLYRQALNLAAGKSIDTPLPADTSGYALAIPAGGLSDVNAQVGFRYLQQFAAVEAAHRDFLRGAISAGGGAPVGPNPGGYQAPFGSDLRSILLVIREVEETGVRAYLGAARFITDITLTQTAATIYSTEARHSAAINYLLGFDAGPEKQRYDSQAVVDQNGQNNFEYWLTPSQVLRAVGPFLV